MDTITITKLHDIIDLSVNQKAHVFRGVTDAEKHKLIPSIGRRLRAGEKTALLKTERTVINMFRRNAVPFLERSDYDIWDTLAIAQHHGLPTRLMDWTTNLCVALFFAVEGQSAGDSAVYSCPAVGKAILPADDPFALDKDFWFFPRHVTLRIAAQAGIFSVQKDPTSEFRRTHMKRIIIPLKLRIPIRAMLNKWGINRASLYPGLEGLAAWLGESYEKFRQSN